MNKELINKYKPEFDHWLNGGSLCIYRTDTEEFWEPTTILNWDPFTPETIVYIINDKYVEFRKALAEGKTVEADVNYWSYPSTSIQNWKECPQDSFHKYSLENLRIKPIEFKLGDFVRYVNSTSDKVLQINYIDDDRYYFKQTEMSCLAHELELWQPQADEWCWFWDKPSDKFANISRFKELYKNKFKSVNYEWTYCAPFIGELPPHLKD